MRLLMLSLLFISSSLYAANGQLQVFVFKGNTSQAQHKVIIDNKAYITDEQGMIIISVKEGDHLFRLDQASSNKKVYVVSDTVSQVMAQISETGEPQIDIFEPKRILAVSDNEKVINLKGIVKNEKGEMISGVRIYLKGATSEAVTNERGLFQIEIPQGEQAITIIHPQFTTQTIQVKNGPAQELAIVMTPLGLNLKQMTVSAPHIKGSASSLIDVRKRSSQVNDVLGAEQMSKSGDSDAAGSLKRVTGLTLVDGKYVYIRGLGERYSSTLLNESNIPGPDPSRRVIPLDMFPSSILEGIIVQKSYSVDMPAEFGGGVVKLKTKSVPEKAFVKAELSSTFSDGGNSHLSYKGGSTDWLGIDDGTRALPRSVLEATANNKKLAENNIVFQDGYSADQLAQFGRDMPNNYNTEQSQQSPPPSFSLAAGDRHELGMFKAGYLLGAMYGNSWDSSQKRKTKYVVETGSTLKVDRDFDVQKSEHTIKLGGMLNLGLEWGDNKDIAFNVFVLRHTSDDTEISSGYHSDLDQIKQTKLEWTERQLLAYQLQGHQIYSSLANLEMNWRGSYATATMERPDAREYRYENDNGVLKFSTRNDGNQRIYANLEDITKNAGVDFSLPVTWYTSLPAKIMWGGAMVNRDRDSRTRRFTFVDKGIADPTGTLREGPLEDILIPGNINPTGFQLQENTLATDNYVANQQIRAGYGAVEIPILNPLTFGVGMRYERSLQYVKTFELFSPDNNPAIASLETVDYLPAYNLTMKWTDRWQTRLAYSETVSRPDFKELSTATYTDDERGVDVVGNELLESTVIKSIDARLEWYGVGKDAFSVGVFQKEFDKPIESIIRPGTEGKLSFDNALQAKNQGLEFEFNKNFNFISRRLQPFSFGGNLSWIKSRIVLDPAKSGVLTTEDRPLQGQSPYVYNLNLDYDNKDTGTIITLLYNIFGERISDVGTGGAPDILEHPFAQLDLVASQKIGGPFGIKIKLKNLINPESLRTQGDQITEVYRKGREVSLALNGSF